MVYDAECQIEDSYIFQIKLQLVLSQQAFRSTEYGIQVNNKQDNLKTVNMYKQYHKNQELSNYFILISGLLSMLSP